LTERWRALREYPEAERILQTMDSDPRVAALRARMPEVYRELAPHRWLVAALERLPILVVRRIPTPLGEAVAATTDKLIIDVSLEAAVELELRDLTFALAHEAMHALMADTVRRRELDRLVVEYANDALNNTLLRDVGITPTAAWKQYYIEDVLPGRGVEEVTFEELYEAIVARWRAGGREVVPGRPAAGRDERYEAAGVVQVGDPDLYDEDPGVVARARRRWLRAVLRAPDLPPAVRRGIESGWADLLGARRGK